jgi:hypothetical protein
MSIMIIKNYAIIENDIVVNVVIGDNEWAANQQSTLVELTDSDNALVGGKYIDGVFYKPKPYPSWVESGSGWAPPVPKPENIEGFGWMWNEESLSWVSLTISASLANEELTDEFAD